MGLLGTLIGMRSRLMRAVYSYTSCVSSGIAGLHETAVRRSRDFASGWRRYRIAFRVDVECAALPR